MTNNRVATLLQEGLLIKKVTAIIIIEMDFVLLYVFM